ncbi:Xanthine/uracil permease [Lactarius quietus]|nr:Xanthine/uracil permease [Lactarius quietus]
MLTKDQPRPTPRPSPSIRPNAQAYILPSDTIRARIVRLRRKLTTRQGWFGDYDYSWLCTPTLPFALPGRPSKRSHLPILLAITTGLQHALAMLAGLITPPIIFASALNLDATISAYMISASLIGCGILSFVQMSRIKLFGNYYLGTGLISVVGTSFATLSTANSIFDAMYSDGTCPTITATDGTTSRGPCPDAYGKLLGTSLIASFLEIFMSFVPPRILQRVFPPIVTGTVILLIGASLIGSSGIPNWGGGSNACSSRPSSGFFQFCPDIAAPRPLLWGSPQFIGLGFLSFVSILLVELFGSPFLKNVSIIVGLAVGCIVAGATGYIDSSSIKSAPSITFLWVHTFKIGIYAPAILPMLAVYISLAMEAIGDITASAEVSRVEVEGEDFESRIQGGVLSDGLGGFFSALFTVTPLSIFAQNNGAGRWCCFFLLLFGILGKLSGVFLASIPQLGSRWGNTFLFASVATSGLRVLAYAQFTRRDRFVLAAALSIGFGDLLGLQGLLNSITIILSTPFLSGGIVATILNLILPQEDLSSEDEGADREEVDIEDAKDTQDEEVKTG